MDVDLRPLSLGEILDRIFQLYRAHFLMFVGMATIAATVDLVWKLIQTGLLQFISHHVAVKTLGVFTTGLSVPNMIVYIVASAVAMAAINRAVSAIYLGKPTGIAQAYREVKPHWGRYVLLYVVASIFSWGPAILLVIAVAAFGGFSGGLGPGTIASITFLGMVTAVPFGIWMMLRYSLANPSCVFEEIGIMAALKRSVYLSQRLRFRIFIMGFLAFMLIVILTMAGMTPITVQAIRNPGPISILTTIYTLVVQFVTTSLTTPFVGIGLTLFYYDARIRKEGFDIEWMMMRATPVETEPVPPIDPIPEPAVLG